MSLEPARQDFTIIRGATFSKRMTYFSDEAGTDPVDLSGYTAELVVKNPTTQATLLDLTSGDGIVLGGGAGTIVITVDAATTSALTWNGGAYQLSLTDADGETDILLYGSIRVRSLV